MLHVCKEAQASQVESHGEREKCSVEPAVPAIPTETPEKRVPGQLSPQMPPTLGTISLKLNETPKETHSADPCQFIAIS